MYNLRFLILVILLLVSNFVFSANVDTLVVQHKTMQKQILITVIKPNSYPNSEKKFPVVYLLHGYSDDYGSYLDRLPKLKTMADQMDIIIVCPDGGYSSWYVDSPFDKGFQYETFVAKELIALVDSSYKTIKNREGRAITGLSMGGHGALLMAIKHPDVFGAAGSMSGGVDLTFKPKSWHISKRLGDYANNKELWLKNSVYHQIGLLKDKDTKLIIDCGYDDFFYGVNLKLHKKLLELGIEHDFIIRPGNHSWKYWENSIDYQFLFFYKKFNIK